MHQDVDVLPVEDERVVLDEAFEFEVPCEIPSFTQDAACYGDVRPAEWIAFRSIICSCGIIVRLVCDPCRVKYQTLMAHHAHLSCPHCGDETNGFDRFEPLKGSS